MNVWENFIKHLVLRSLGEGGREKTSSVFICSADYAVTSKSSLHCAVRHNFTQKAQSFLPCHGAMKWSRDIFTKFQKPCLWSRSLWSLVKTFRLRSTCLSRRNLRSRWRLMKFSRFLLRQGCGGQAGSKDGVTFLLRYAYTAASRLDFYFCLFDGLWQKVYGHLRTFADEYGQVRISRFFHCCP